jgi:hypothetical protein
MSPDDDNMMLFSWLNKPIVKAVLVLVFLSMPDCLRAGIVVNPPGEETGSAHITRNNAVFVEMFGSTLNLFGVNYERTFRNKLHVRAGASRLTYVDEITYEETGEDISIKLHTLPFSVTRSFFSDIRKLELGVGATLFHFDFWGGPYDVGYNDIELGNRFVGLALTTTIGYRLSLENYLFRIGLHPLYMFTIHNEISGFFEELDDRGVLDFRDIIDPRGFMVVPGVSFGRRF